MAHGEIRINGQNTVDEQLAAANAAVSQLSAQITELENTGVDTAARTAILEKTSYGVISGLGVTAQSTPDMTVKAATGVIYMVSGNRLTPAKNDALAVTAADAANPRIDIVYVSSAGVISCLAGTAAAAPSAPAVPAGGQKIAEISVAANAAAIQAENIADKRRLNLQGEWIMPTLLNGWTGSVQFKKLNDGLVVVRGDITPGALDYGTVIFLLPAGYKIGTGAGQFVPVFAVPNSNGTPRKLGMINNDKLWVGYQTEITGRCFINFTYYATE